ncbi:EamA family transporter [Microbacterium stercoris]|uniref:EamA family transporter n=1 Tax=Microbacterium stercoris TaxID=2820289 RepID=A0A939TWL8_9MICO|nr:EamA family transporter [Microbacterium stercoris]MBO3662792.1 EamA family transporter [Microbacterium stercoris]
MSALRSTSSAAVGLVALGLACQEIGAAIAVRLFPHTGPLGIVMLRLVFSALILLAIARPSLRGRTRAQWAAVVRLGLALAVMNGMFYLALERLALGVTVTIEVLGPLALSILVAGTRVAWLWAGLALAGVVALGGGGWDRLDPVGVIFALGAAVFWAAYIRCQAAVGRAFPQLEGLALAMAIGALVSLPFGVAAAGPALIRIDLLALGAGVAILSSTIPYALELIALRRMSEAAFGILMSLSPATAALAGWLLLGQGLTWLEAVGLALVVCASAGAVWRARGRPAEPLA